MSAGSDRRPSALVAVGTGGALGTLGRYGLVQALPRAAGGFPWATFLANVTGAFVLGVVATLVVERWPPTTYARPFLAVGLCGGFTTWSTFMTDTTLLARDGEPLVAAAYVGATLTCGLLATGLGIGLARQWPPRGRRGQA